MLVCTQSIKCQGLNKVAQRYTSHRSLPAELLKSVAFNARELGNKGERQVVIKRRPIIKCNLFLSRFQFPLLTQFSLIRHSLNVASVTTCFACLTKSNLLVSNLIPPIGTLPPSTWFKFKIRKLESTGSSGW